MAVAVEERTLPKTLSWKDGFMIALSVPAGVLASLGFSIGSLGAWGAAALWGICCLLGLLQNYLFAEMAAMFPEKPGGVALYAHEAWRKYFSPIGPICAFGYWMGWSFVLSIFGLTIGQLVTAQWFPGQTWTFSDGVVDVGLPHLIGAAAVVIVWALNVFGLRPSSSARSSPVTSTRRISTTTSAKRDRTGVASNWRWCGCS
jgi:amino acid transporter